MGESKFEIYPSRNMFGRRRWRFRIRAANGRILASGEAYHNKTDCQNAIQVIKTTSRIQEMAK